MFKRFFKIGVICFMVFGIAYCGACIYSNFIQREPGEYALPSVDKAQYEVTIRNTNNIIYTDSFETEGTKYILNGYWELTNSKYRFKGHILPLDQKIFGEITVRSR